MLTEKPVELDTQSEDVIEPVVEDNTPVVDEPVIDAEQAAKDAIKAERIARFNADQERKAAKKAADDLAYQQRHMTDKQKDEMNKQIAADKKAAAKRKAEALRNAGPLNQPESIIKVDLSMDQVGRGKARYGSK